MPKLVDRRTFLQDAGRTGAGLVVLSCGAAARSYAANAKLDVALVGVWGRGRWFLQTIPKMENVVAWCDVNDKSVENAAASLAELAKKWKTSEHSWERKASEIYTATLAARPPHFHDFRVMLDKHKGIDAVIVATPDHTHAVVSAAAIKAGKAVFCEKPLTRAVGESRALRELARKHKVATTMGNQGTYTGGFRRALELIQGGTLGEITEVHIWNSGGGSDKKVPPKGDHEVPPHLKWDLWLGPAAERPYHPDWLRRNAWRDFGTCQLGNWASHTANLAVMSMRVHDLWLTEPPKDAHPIIKVRAETSGINRLSFPRWEKITWEIPARGDLKPIAFVWYNGRAPGVEAMLEPVMAKGAEEARRRWRFAGAYIVGTKGAVHSTGHNATFRLLPGGRFQDVQRTTPEKVEKSRGPERDFFDACRGGKPPWSSFEYADALNEFLMLGNVATQFEGVLEFDPWEMKIVNHAAADALLRPAYREGWEL